MIPLALHLALLLSFAESLGLALLLGLFLRGVSGGAYLVLFLLGVAIWIAGCELPSWFGPAVIPLSERLIGLSSLTSAVFLHFVLVFCRIRWPLWLMSGLYLIAGLTTLLALILPAGDYQAWAGITLFFVPNLIGWLVGLVWAGFAGTGHLIMARVWLRAGITQKRQLMALFLSSGWGAVTMMGYGFHPLGIEITPFPLLFLPAYPVILVYGILRYQLMIVNAWARRALAWTLLMGLGSLVMIGLAALPVPFSPIAADLRLWFILVISLLSMGLLQEPLRRLATRLIYPGTKLDPADLEHWRRILTGADGVEDLADRARSLISAQLHLEIDVQIGGGQQAQARPECPLLLTRRLEGHWQSQLIGWDAAPPGPRHVAEMFGVVLADAASRLEQALTLAERERETQKQARLAELGALAATVAHDIRNPLNIIAMAAATAPPALRQEIAEQTGRIAQLATDLLDYAKSWQIDRQSLDLGQEIRAIAPRYPEFILEPSLDQPLPLTGDRRRLRQVFTNLFDNARAAAPSAIAIAASRRDDGITLEIADNGSGIPESIRDSLFQPFVSRRPGGTGLGLAIVAKIMEAHGGHVAVTERPGWTTCFSLYFPGVKGPRPVAGFADAALRVGSAQA